MRHDPTFDGDPRSARNNASRDAARSSNGSSGAAVLRATGLALDNPVAAGGVLVMLLTSSLIVANAVSFQPGPHPAPLFATRTPSVVTDPDAPQPTQLLRDLQASLHRIGYYNGVIDGLNGPRTENAIRAYESASGLAETGRPSHALRARLILEDVALPPTNPDRTAPTAMPTPTSVADVASNGNTTGSIEPQAKRDTIRVVQQILADYGYGPLTVDGVMGGETASAVRRFELDRGMDIDGHLDEPLFAALEKVSGKPVPR